MELTDTQIDRITELGERQQLTVDFEAAVIRLRRDHQDLNSEQYNRREGYLVDRDDLALGAAIAMMDVRDGVNSQKAERTHDAQ